jgi:hypothetical protein
MGTTFGQLYNYGFDSESPRWDWLEVDRVLFNKPNHSGNELNLNILMRMIQEQFELPLTNVWWVHVLANGLVELNDFTLPSNTGKLRESFKQEELPQWIQDSLSVLMIVDQGSTVEGVGKKITDSIFYLMETPEIGDMYGNKARS